MRGLKDYCVVLFWARPASVGLMLLVFFGVFVVSCDEVERYEVLTFFFDGVPPLEAETSGTEEGPVEADSPSSVATRVQERPKAVEHGSRKDCDFCHERLWEVGRMEFVKLLPELCYHCHTDYTVSASFVHGPVAVGDCLFCHNLHKSKNEHLLKEPEPKLCYQCHEKKGIESIPDHSAELASECLDCHEGHSSLRKGLLKIDWKDKAN